MLTFLRNTIKKKKLYFIVKYSVSNTKRLTSLLKLNIVSAFHFSSHKKKTFLIAFINYNHNFEAAISSFSKNSSKTATGSNLILHIDNKKTRLRNNRIKFR